MTGDSDNSLAAVRGDLTAGLVVFLVALPLCLGIALASNAPLLSGVIAGVVGGVVVGLLSGSQTSVSGPAAGLTAVVAAQIAMLGSFEAFQAAVVWAGLIQLALGVARAGFLAAFVPTAVIQGLLAAIGVILILKQIPHVLGHDDDPEGDMSFDQFDSRTTFSELGAAADDWGFQNGAAFIGVAAFLLLLLWDRWKLLKKSPVPAPLVVVVLGVAGAELFRVTGIWFIDPSHMVNVPVAGSFDEFAGFFRLPAADAWFKRPVMIAAFTIAAVASLETLLNLEAVDKLDPRKRVSPASRELVAQGVGNTVSGLIGGLPVTAVIIRGSVNILAGGRTKRSAVIHGVLLAVAVALMPTLLNRIPLSCLAAILLATGIKLASWKLVKQMWAGGPGQFVPFLVTVVAIVRIDLLVGIVFGLVTSLAFILRSNYQRPLRVTVEKHLGGTVTKIELANQVSFLNRAAITTVLDAVPPGGNVMFDARRTDYIDPDILALIREYDATVGPARGVEVSLRGFRDKYEMPDKTTYAVTATQELQTALTPADVLQTLKDGNARFRAGRRLARDYGRLLPATASAQYPLAVVLGCIDSRTPAEIIFDLGVGDVFAVRVAGNIPTEEVIGSIEYGCAVAGAKLVVVVGHTRCGAVTAALHLAGNPDPAAATGCGNIASVLKEIQAAGGPDVGDDPDELARRNVARTVGQLLVRSHTLASLVAAGKLNIVGGMYDIATGEITFVPAA